MLNAKQTMLEAALPAPDLEAMFARFRVSESQHLQ